VNVLTPQIPPNLISIADATAKYVYMEITTGKLVL